MQGPGGQSGNPTKAELMRMPKWATVVFAARCARRVQPVFTRVWKDAPRQHVEAIDKAISLSEAVAQRGASWDLFEAVDDAASAGRAAYSTSVAGPAAVHAAGAAYTAVYAAAYAAHAATSTCPLVLAGMAAMMAGDAARYASDAAANDATDTGRSCFVSDAARVAREAAYLQAFHAACAAARADYITLVELGKLNAWTHESPVDVALLGPLWPEGAKPR